jgi:transcriptional regulator with XRE-family HTH domain
MELREYLFRYNITQKEFAEKVGCARAYITLVAGGIHIPGKRLAQDIEKVTAGLVKAKDFDIRRNKRNKERKLQRQSS